VSEGFFQGGPKMLKFHFSILKLGKRRFFAKTVIGKCQISKSSGAFPPVPFRLPWVTEPFSKWGTKVQIQTNIENFCGLNWQI